MHPKIVEVSLFVQFKNEHFFVEQGRTGVFGETYSAYVAAGNPRRTLLDGKRVIFEWTQVNGPRPSYHLMPG